MNTAKEYCMYDKFTNGTITIVIISISVKWNGIEWNSYIEYNSNNLLLNETLKFEDFLKIIGQFEKLR